MSADNGGGLQHINTIVGFDAVWELDLFGKFRREFEAARAETEAARAARYDVLTSVSPTWCAPMSICADFRCAPEYCTRRAMCCASRCGSSISAMSAGITNELDVALATRELATFEARDRPGGSAGQGGAIYARRADRRISGADGRKSSRRRT